MKPETALILVGGAVLLLMFLGPSLNASAQAQASATVLGAQANAAQGVATGLQTILTGFSTLDS